jgi:hypothetical protein
MTADQCEPLSVLCTRNADGFPVVISCWKIEVAELEEIFKTGRIWLTVIGDTMPPVWLEGRRPFDPVPGA